MPRILKQIGVTGNFVTDQFLYKTKNSRLVVNLHCENESRYARSGIVLKCVV